MKIRLIIPLVLAVAATPLFGESIGPLTASGNVWTNQIAVPSGSSVYAGDLVRTDENGIAVIDSGRTRIEVRPTSSVTLHTGGLNLHQGSVGSSHSVVELADARVSPVGDLDDSWFVVSEVEGQTMVAAYRGDAEIVGRDGRRTIVPAGSFALAASTPRAGSDSLKKSDGKGTPNTEAAPAGTKKKGGWTLGSLASTTGVLVVTGVAAATLTGFAVTGDDAPAVSPR
jgi:hypothetical protein